MQDKFETILSKRNDIEKMQEKTFESFLEPIKQIYIDYSFIQDISVSPVMEKIFKEKREELYKTFKEELTSYNERDYTETSKYFSLLESEKEIESFLRNSENHFFIGRVSPFTKFINYFIPILSDIENKLQMLEKKGENILIAINTFPVKIDEFSSSRIRNLFKSLNKNIIVGFYCKEITEFKEKFFEKTDMFFFDRLDRIFSNKTELNEKIFRDLSWSLKGKTVYTKPFLYPDTKMGEFKVEEVLSRTKDLLNTFFDFDYVEKEFLTIY